MTSYTNGLKFDGWRLTSKTEIIKAIELAAKFEVSLTNLS